MRLRIVLLIVLVLAVTMSVRAAGCPGRHCVYIPVVGEGERAGPTPSAAPAPSTVPAPSTAPAPSPSTSPTPSTEPVPSAEPIPSPSATPAPSSAPSEPPPPITRWTQGAPSPIDRSEAEGVAIGAKLYVFGGYSYPLDGWTPYSRVDVYDTTTNEWTRLRDLPRAVNHAGVATDGQYVYFAGGYVANEEGDGAEYGSRSVFRYDIAADSYIELSPLPLNRAAGALVLVGRTLHYFGGTNKERSVDTGEHWSFDLDAPDATWQPRAALPNPRNHLGAVELSGQIFAVGGQHDHDGDLVTQSDVHRYDPLTDVWTAVAPLPAVLIDGNTYGRGHIGAATFVRDGKIVVAGGEYEHMKPLRGIIQYDPATDSWQELGLLPERRYSGVARYFGDRLVYATGGTDGAELTNTTLIGLP